MRKLNPILLFIIVVVLASVGSVAQAAQCAERQALCPIAGGGSACVSNSGFRTGPCGGGNGTYNECNNCVCNANYTKCDDSGSCVFNSGCSAGETFNACARGGLGACETPYALRSPSGTQSGDYISVTGGSNPTTNAAGGSTVPVGALYFNTSTTPGRLRVKTSATDWTDVQGESYTASPTSNLTIIGNAIATVASPRFSDGLEADTNEGAGGDRTSTLFVHSATDRVGINTEGPSSTLTVNGDVGIIGIAPKLGIGTGTTTLESGDLGLIGNIYLNSDKALRVDSNASSQLNVGNYHRSASDNDGFQFRLHSPDNSIAEILLNQGSSDRWALSVRGSTLLNPVASPSRNFEIWRNNPTGTWAPSLQINFSDGAILAATRFGVGAGAPAPQDKSVGIERHFTVGGQYKNPVSGRCPAGTFLINLNETRGESGLEIIDAGECYQPDAGVTLNQSVLSGRLNMFGDARFREDVTVSGGTEVQGLTAHREIIIKPVEDTFNARLPGYLRIENLDNDSGNGNPLVQEAFKIGDEDDNEWFSVKRTGYVTEGGVTPVLVRTNGNIQADRNVQGNNLYAFASAGSGGSVYAQDRVIASRFVMRSEANTLSVPGAGFVFDVSGNSRFLNDLTVLGELRLGSRSVLTASRGVFNSVGDDITSSTAGGILTVGGGAQYLRLDSNEISTNGGYTLNLQEHSTGPVRIHQALHVNGIITAGSSFAPVPLTDIGGSLKMDTLADEDWGGGGSKGAFIVGARESVECGDVCENHGLNCATVEWLRGRPSGFVTGCTSEEGTRLCWCD